MFKEEIKEMLVTVTDDEVDFKIRENVNIYVHLCDCSNPILTTVKIFHI